MAGTRQRVVQLEKKVPPAEKVFLVNWRNERFTKDAGVEITREEFEQLRSLPGAVVFVLPFADCDMV